MVQHESDRCGQQMMVFWIFRLGATGLFGPLYQRPGRCAVCNYMYRIIHSPQGFLGRIYNTGQRNLPDCSVASPGKESAFRFPLMFRPNWGSKGQKIFFETGPPSLSQSLDDRPPSSSPYPPLLFMVQLISNEGMS